MAEERPSQEERDARLWASLCHLSSLVVFVGIPFGNILGPLVCWLIKRNEYVFVDEQGKESLNFQLSVTLYAMIGAMLTFLSFLVLAFSGQGESTPVAMIIPFGIIAVLILLALLDLVLVFVAAVRASDGRPYHYPITIPFF